MARLTELTAKELIDFRKLCTMKLINLSNGLLNCKLAAGAPIKLTPMNKRAAELRKNSKRLNLAAL